MSGIEIREIGFANPLLDQVEGLFLQLYDFMARTGLMMPLVEGGQGLWRKSVEKGLGRFGCLLVALQKDTVVGFAHGMIRFVPEYLGGYKVGYITHTFVSPNSRGRGLGRKMVSELEKWFSDRDVHSVEVQVLSQNDQAAGFWEELGFEKELIQLRRRPHSSGSSKKPVF